MRGRLLALLVLTAAAAVPAAAGAASFPRGPASHGGGGVVEVKEKKSGHWRDVCMRAARERGWRVRDAGEQKRFDGDGGKWMVPMRVRDGRDRFDVSCQAYADGKVTLDRRE